jgi:hypothetical protein
MIDWYLEGVEFGNCNCGWCFPCEHDAGPSRGHCRGFEVIRVERGHFGDIPFSGLNVALLYAWPGPLFDGEGELQAVIDERANGAQRWALATILYGGETEEAKTHWWVFNAMSRTMHPPLFRPIVFKVELQAGTASVSIPGILEVTGQPIKNAAIGSDHGVRIDVVNAPRKTRRFAAAQLAGSSVELDVHGGFGQFGVLRHSGSGVVHRA